MASAQLPKTYPSLRMSRQLCHSPPFTRHEALLCNPGLTPVCFQVDRAHDTMAVTGVAWQQRLPAGDDRSPLSLLSSGLNRVVRFWRLTDAQVRIFCLSQAAWPYEWNNHFTFSGSRPTAHLHNSSRMREGFLRAGYKFTRSAREKPFPWKNLDCRDNSSFGGQD